AEINPARRSGHTYAGLRAAQSLATEARALLEALELMWARGERELHVPTLTQALRALDGQRRAARVTTPPAAPPAPAGPPAAPPRPPAPRSPPGPGCWPPPTPTRP